MSGAERVLAGSQWQGHFGPPHRGRYRLWELRLGRRCMAGEPSTGRPRSWDALGRRLLPRRALGSGTHLGAGLRRLPPASGAWVQAPPAAGHGARRARAKERARLLLQPNSGSRRRRRRRRLCYCWRSDVRADAEQGQKLQKISLARFRVCAGVRERVPCARAAQSTTCIQLLRSPARAEPRGLTRDKRGDPGGSSDKP